MYKIFLKINTSSDRNLYECYREENDDGDLAELELDTLEDVELKIKELLKEYSSEELYIMKPISLSITVDAIEPVEVNNEE